MQCKIGLFYGSSTCYTEMAGEKIAACINAMPAYIQVNLHNIASAPISLMAEYSYLILGIPTWDYGELQEDWESHWDSLDAIDFSDKKVAVYGLGDQIGYPEWFQDALGYLWAKVKNQGGTMVGAWPNEGYEFDNSQALTPDRTQFVGLALDDENQIDLTDPYIDRWCQQIIREFNLHP